MDLRVCGLGGRQRSTGGSIPSGPTIDDCGNMLGRHGADAHMLSIVEHPVMCSGGVELLTLSDAEGRPFMELYWHQFDDHWDMHVEACADPSVHWIVNFVRVDDSVVVGTRPPPACDALLTRLEAAGDLDRWEGHWPLLRTLQYGDFETGFLANFEMATGRVPWFIVADQMTDMSGQTLEQLHPAMRTAVMRSLRLGLAFLEELPAAYVRAVVAEPAFDKEGPGRLQKTFEGAKSVLDVLDAASKVLKFVTGG